ncbi:UNVERIFIED_CONTAM: hypothetical protein K2H54_074414 [Gekko kuhli]
MSLAMVRMEKLGKSPGITEAQATTKPEEVARAQAAEELERGAGNLPPVLQRSWTATSPSISEQTQQREKRPPEPELASIIKDIISDKPDAIFKVKPVPKIYFYH